MDCVVTLEHLMMLHANNANNHVMLVVGSVMDPSAPMLSEVRVNRRFSFLLSVFVLTNHIAGL